MPSLTYPTAFRKVGRDEGEVCRYLNFADKSVSVSLYDLSDTTLPMLAMSRRQECKLDRVAIHGGLQVAGLDVYILIFTHIYIGKSCIDVVYDTG